MPYVIRPFVMTNVDPKPVEVGGKYSPQEIPTEVNIASSLRGGIN